MTEKNEPEPRALANQDKPSALLGLVGLAVGEVAREPSGALTVGVRTADPAARACPDCKTVATASHGWVRTRPRDLHRGSAGGQLVWRKRRWKCENPACPRRTFTETAPAVPARMRLTTRLRSHAAHLVGELGATVSAAAAECGLSWPTAHRAFVAAAEAVLAPPLARVSVLGIDETRRGRPRFERDSDTGEYTLLADRWHTGFVDLSGDAGLLGQVEGRTADDAAYWLAQAGPAWRSGVGVVVIDMCTIYAAAVRRMLPDATLAVDPFHVVQLGTKMVSDVRRRVVRAKYGRRGRSGDAEYGVKNLLVRNIEHLRPEQYQRVVATLAGDEHGKEIAAAWIAKEKLRNIIRLRASFTGIAPTPYQVRAALHDFYSWCADHAHIPELVTLARTVDRWQQPIVAAVLLNVSNAKSEGLNRILKLEGRKAYGFRNAVNQRRRLRYATTRSSRRPRTRTRRRSRYVTVPQLRPG
ncbi:MAG: ISL3 family transposase [Mycobacteriales bacterium]